MASVSRYVLILLMVLLPLRGWSAERMAVYMAASDTAAVATATAQQAMPADCPMMVQADTAKSGADHSKVTSDRSCQSCQLCMALAMLATETPSNVFSQPFTAASAHADRFASADLARAAKPPIS